jgi:hypothetical protein
MKYVDLERSAPSPIFTRQDLLLLGLKVHDHQLSQWVRKGYLVRLKNGIYAFARDMAQLRVEHVAFLLYQPSYLSLETALSHYGFIPETVYARTSITAKITRTFDTPLGRFIYRHVKPELFWGYVAHQSPGGGPYLLAEPEKALLDYLYLNRAALRTPAAMDALRLNQDQLRLHLDEKKFLRYLAGFNIPNMQRLARQCLP